MHQVNTLFVLLLMVFLSSSCAREEHWKPVASKPLLWAHAHNDYEHKRPLLDALDHGFTSVEADVHLVSGKLLVAHTWFGRDPKKTLEGLYLAPLMARFKRWKGRIFSHPARTFLLIDIKTDAKSTYKAIHAALSPYKSMLSRVEEGKLIEGAVMVIISGNRPLSFMKIQKTRLAFYDGRPEDLEKNPALPASLMPMVSAKWSWDYGWYGAGEMPAHEQNKLKAYVEKAHKQKRIVRFWGTYDKASAERKRLWEALLTHKVDLINTDDLTGLQQFSLSRHPDLRLPQKKL